MESIASEPQKYERIEIGQRFPLFGKNRTTPIVVSRNQVVGYMFVEGVMEEFTKVKRKIKGWVSGISLMLPPEFGESAVNATSAVGETLRLVYSDYLTHAPTEALNQITIQKNIDSGRAISALGFDRRQHEHYLLRVGVFQPELLSNSGLVVLENEKWKFREDVIPLIRGLSLKVYLPVLGTDGAPVESGEVVECESRPNKLEMDKGKLVFNYFKPVNAESAFTKKIYVPNDAERIKLIEGQFDFTGAIKAYIPDVFSRAFDEE